MVSRERRRAQRYEVLGIRGWSSTREPVVLRDLNTEGLRIETSARPRPGTTFRLGLETDGHRLELETRCAWAHLMGMGRLPGAEPCTVYSAGLRLPDRSGTVEREIKELLASHAIYPPSHPLSCILPTTNPSLRERGAVPGEVRRIGLSGLAAIFPSLPPLGTIDLDVAVLLGGTDCLCRCTVIEQKKITLPGNNVTSELFLAFQPSDHELRALVHRYLETLSLEMEREGIPKEHRPILPQGTSGERSMFA